MLKKAPLHPLATTVRTALLCTSLRDFEGGGLLSWRVALSALMFCLTHCLATHYFTNQRA
ncbi:acyl-CoA dehydrogenase [Acetobacter orientalis]|uniref:Acyl-CoA dehydrogenase n=1 Tax=Acetobacter orientalis TaxID=146474 RepID=A0A2Z5ZJ87_9PROT|nr:acyl-CoA dehydrogenase [Acetobacter orientalis]